ncbi:MAG: 50S ribosomal protein L30 [Chloroflexi bacterium]|nr:50S ribosomal protein L30 [Chloroflexota bacterium]
MSDSRKIRITWVKSSIGQKEDQKATIRALGFHRLNESVDKVETPTVRGMINKVRHMVEIREIESE